MMKILVQIIEFFLKLIFISFSFNYFGVMFNFFVTQIFIIIKTVLVKIIKFILKLGFINFNYFGKMYNFFVT